MVSPCEIIRINGSVITSEGEILIAILIMNACSLVNVGQHQAQTNGHKIDNSTSSALTRFFQPVRCTVFTVSILILVIILLHCRT